MKIAILTSGILPVPAVQGGAVENLIDYYLEYNDCHQLHDITVFSIWHPKVKNHPAQQSTVNHYCYIDTTNWFAKLKRKLYSLFHSNEYYNYFIEYYFEEAFKHIKKEHYDYILLENRPGYICKLSKRTATNLILHLHNDLLNSQSPHAEEILKNLKKIITVSDYIKQRVATIPCTFTTPIVTTVYNGINLKKFKRKSMHPVTRDKLGLSDSDFVLAYSGRLIPEKGISQLIDAILLLKDYPRIKLMILGGTFFADSTNENCFVRTLKEKALPIKNRLTFTGFIPYDNMPDYLQLADAAVIPSLWAEPFGLTLIEAQAMGLPTIASKQGGIPELVNDGNALVVATDYDYVQKLADAIILLYQSPQLRSNMALAAKQNASHYGKERYASEFFEVIGSLSK